MAVPEDVILGKLWYFNEGGSEKHLRDIAAMLQMSGELIDDKYVELWAQRLGYAEHWRLVVDRVQNSRRKDSSDRDAHRALYRAR